MSLLQLRYVSRAWTILPSRTCEPSNVRESSKGRPSINNPKSCEPMTPEATICRLKWLTVSVLQNVTENCVTK